MLGFVLVFRSVAYAVVHQQVALNWFQPTLESAATLTGCVCYIGVRSQRDTFISDTWGEGGWIHANTHTHVFPAWNTTVMGSFKKECSYLTILFTNRHVSMGWSDTIVGTAFEMYSWITTCQPWLAHFPATSDPGDEDATGNKNDEEP